MMRVGIRGLPDEMTKARAWSRQQFTDNIVAEHMIQGHTQEQVIHFWMNDMPDIESNNEYVWFDAASLQAKGLKVTEEKQEEAGEHIELLNQWATDARSTIRNGQKSWSTIDAGLEAGLPDDCLPISVLVEASKIFQMERTTG